MTITDGLRGEHLVLKLAVEVLERAGHLLSRREPVDLAACAELVALVWQYAEREHLTKEESVLLPALLGAGLPSQSGPVAVMLFEHVRGRELLAQLLRACADLEKVAARDAFASAAVEYAQLFSAHMVKEDSVLFPLADRLISAERQASGLAELARMNQDLPSGGDDVVRARLLDLRARLLRHPEA